MTLAREFSSDTEADKAEESRTTGTLENHGSPPPLPAKERVRRGDEERGIFHQSLASSPRPLSSFLVRRRGERASRPATLDLARLPNNWDFSKDIRIDWLADLLRR